ncbi:MAG TPA: sugar transferase, partial [Cryptosporangiaceae bacterium]|nr:sugar transferase [Cryptosporangiaceae bacterium]
MTPRAAGRAVPARDQRPAAPTAPDGTSTNGSVRSNGRHGGGTDTVGSPAPAEPPATFSTVAADGASPTAPEPLSLETTGVQRSPRTRGAGRNSGWSRRFQGTLVVQDLLCCALAGWIVINVYEQARAGFFNEQMLVLMALVGLPMFWGLMLWAHGAYEGRYLGLGPDEFKRVVKAAISLTAVVCFLAFTLKADLSRAAVGTVLPLTVVLTLSARFLARKVLHFVRRRGRAAQRILLVGTLGEALSVYRITTRNPHAGLAPVGICLTESTSETVSLPIPVFNGKVDPIERVQQIGADTVAVCGARGVSPDALRRLAWQLEGTGIDLVVAPALTNIAGPRVHIRPVEGLPLLHVEEPTISGVGWLFKGLLDRVVAFLGLLLISPLLATAAVAIRMTSPGPVFFRQERVGRGGETIRVWKFRTMYEDAEQRLADLLGGNETDGLLFKMRDDPRITPIGHLLRKTSIDELPQLINVLLGEMSLVGPRPLPVQNED